MATYNMKTKTLISLLCMIFIAVTAQASPFLVSDPQTGVERYELTGWTPTTIVAQADGSLRMDVASAVVGTTALTVKACNVWGCSVTVPFDLVRPAALVAPSGTKLVP